MNDDLIKRKFAIKAIEDRRCWLSLASQHGDTGRVLWDEYYIKSEDAIDALLLIPSADRPQEWIPCSERLPSEDEQDPELGVIVTLGNGYSGLQYDWYHGGHWYDWDGFVIAWMPLPKPWKGADDE